MQANHQNRIFENIVDKTKQSVNKTNVKREQPSQEIKKE
jgi:hypothetical protein